MTYDIAHRFTQALDPSALSTITATLHAIEAARRDCRNAGKNDEEDPAVVLLARHLGRVAVDHRNSDATLRSNCASAMADLRRSPALKVLVARSFAGDDRAKSTFHAEGRRALRRLASALVLDPDEYTIRSCMGGSAVMGEVILHGEKVYVQLGQAILGPDRSVLFRRVLGRDDYCGLVNHWASIDELLAPERFAARIAAALGLAPTAQAVEQLRFA